MKRRAQDVARRKSDGEIWLDHATIEEADLEWLAPVQRLTLWNVRVPSGLLAKLPALWWIDWRGGSAAAQRVEQVGACKGLRYLALNQIRGVSTIDFVADLPSLEFLSVYGLAKVTQLPSLAMATNLRRVEIGQMRSLAALAPMLEAPALQELHLSGRIAVTQTDVEAIRAHPSLKAFDWFSEGVPNGVSEPVVRAISLPRVRVCFPSEWFGL